MSGFQLKFLDYRHFGEFPLWNVFWVFPEMPNTFPGFSNSRVNETPVQKIILLIWNYIASRAVPIYKFAYRSDPIQGFFFCSRFPIRSDPCFFKSMCFTCFLYAGMLSTTTTSVVGRPTCSVPYFLHFSKPTYFRPIGLEIGLVSTIYRYILLF